MVRQMYTKSSDWLALDPERTIEQCVSFIKRMVEESRTTGTIIGLSGGIDSSVVASLCVRAIGADRVLGILIPVDFTPQRDIEDAVLLAQQLGIGTKRLEVTQILHDLIGKADNDETNPKTRMARGNLLARLRMAILYYYANLTNRLVAGTSDKSEVLIGFFTKHGDGAADLYPIRHLYKTQVLRIAETLGIPAGIREKPSSPQLYPGHALLDELPLEYRLLDPALYAIFELNMPIEAAGKATGIDIDLLKEINRRHGSTSHKRAAPPTVIQTP